MFGPSKRLDFELELGFVVGVPSTRGEPVPAAAFREHVFGVALVNDWSARDIQAWEYVPLGPFLGKSFATSISAWVTPLALLEDRRVAAPAQVPEPLPYLRVEGDWAFDLPLEVELNGTVISSGNARSLYWTMPQQLAHATSNGASIRTGDLMASGTISGRERGSEGSLIELTWNGTEPVRLEDGSERTFLEDGDEVVFRSQALGEVRGRIVLGAAPLGQVLLLRGLGEAEPRRPWGSPSRVAAQCASYRTGSAIAAMQRASCEASASVLPHSFCSAFRPQESVLRTFVEMSGESSLRWGIRA